MPATETTDFEREFEELVRELRAVPAGAPEDVRLRVRALGEPAVRRAFPVLPWRKSLLVLAPACALALVAAAVVHGVLSSSQTQHPEAVAHSGASGAARVDQGSPVFGETLVPPSTTRHQNYQAWMRLRVKDVDELTRRTNEAMQVVRSYGGYVASVEQSTPSGQPGEADLVLRVPVAHVQDALIRLAALGTVVDRHLSIVDLEQTLRQQRRRILGLRLFIARATEQLKAALPADVRLRLQLQLEQARADLSQATRANTATLREAALSRVSLTLTTQQAVVPVKKSGPGRFGRAAHNAGSFLAGAGAVMLFLLIVLSPVVVLVVAALLGLRAYRRREERRLLAA